MLYEYLQLHKITASCKQATEWFRTEPLPACPNDIHIVRLCVCWTNNNNNNLISLLPYGRKFRGAAGH